jgi:EmrB/QacA subfamily drug resistance transporter
MATAATTRPDGSMTHRQILTILIGLMMGMFLAALDQTIVATAIRTIADDLKGLDQQAWATTAYLITSTIVTPLYGKLSDIYGRKKFFLAAISIFVVGSMLCTLSQSMLQLAFYRAFQGLGAGGLFALALAIIGDIVAPRERAKYQGYFLAVFGTSSVLGPVIGGFLAGQSSILGIDGWRWVFLVNVPIGILALLVVGRTLHLQHTRLDHRIDWGGAVALTVGLVPLLLVAEQGRDWGWTSARSMACFVVGAVGVVAFLLVERAMGDEALVPLTLFKERTVAVASVASVIIGVAMFGGLVSIPLYLQIVKGATPTEAGLMLLPLTLGIMTASIVSGQLISRTGRYRHWPIIGAGLLTAALFVFHYVHADTPLWQTMLVMVFFGAGLGFNFQPLTLAVQNAVSPRLIGVATSSATFSRQIGGTLGGCGVPVHPVHDGAGQDRCCPPAGVPDQGLPGGAARPGQRGVRQAAHCQPSVRRHGRERHRGAEGLLVPEQPRPAAGQALPPGLLRLDGPRVPRRVGRDGVRVPRDVAAAAC